MTMIQVRILKSKDGQSLVEFNDGASSNRCVITSSHITFSGGVPHVDKEILMQGIPYGIPWEYEIKELVITPEQVASSLRTSGIYTAEDVASRPNEVLQSLTACVAPLIREVIQVSKSHKSN